MNCSIAQDQLLHAADDGLAAPQQTALSAHVKSCAACRHYAESIDAIPSLLQQEAKSVSMPDAAEMWSEVSARLNTPDAKPRRVAPILWLAAPLATAAAFIFAFLPQQKHETTDLIAEANTMQVDYVEIEDPDATAMVYVDKKSGWLVVWADDPSVNRG